MINLLTVLHKSIIDIYKIYADSKGYMNFQQFINFSTDYDIFPTIIAKATLYRIFHSLSFMNEGIGSQAKVSKSQLSVRLNSPTRAASSELIDEHLFVESIALIALFNENETQNVQECDEDLDEQKPFS